MKIIAHRGVWNNMEKNRNTVTGFQEAFNRGFGIETDIRDRLGELVISHDPASVDSITVREFFQMYRDNGNDEIYLALNIKADGLQHLLKSLLDEFNINAYFIFDMSLPDSLLYLKKNMNAFTRESEYENVPLFYEDACGVWIDCFHSDWIDGDVIRRHIALGKKVCLVSPELHRRDHLAFWKLLKLDDIWKDDNLILCTDYPEEARRFFSNGKD